MAKTTKSIETFNPLRKERVIVRFVPKENDNIVVYAEALQRLNAQLRA